VQLWTYGGGTNQQWKPVDQGNGAFELVAQHSNACLDVTGGSSADNTRLQQLQCTGGPSQLFAVAPAQ
jgi:glucosylceramidase